MIITEMIKELRRQMGLTQKQFGSLIGKSDSQIADYEHGRCDIPVSVVYAISEATKADIAWLMTGRPHKERAKKYDAKFRVYNEADRKIIVPILVANGYDVGQHKQNRTENGKAVDYYIHITENPENINSCRSAARRE